MRTAYRRLGIKHKVVRINRTQRRSDQVDLIARDKEYLQIMQEHLKKMLEAPVFMSKFTQPLTRL